jgi:hypothetical protein
MIFAERDRKLQQARERRTARQGTRAGTPASPRPEGPFVHRPQSAAGVKAGAAAERSERSLDAGEHRGSLRGRRRTVVQQLAKWVSP